MVMVQYLINGKWVDQLPPGVDEEGILSRATPEGEAQQARLLQQMRQRQSDADLASDAQAAANWAANQRAAGRNVTPADYYREILRQEPPANAPSAAADPRTADLLRGVRRFRKLSNGNVQDTQSSTLSVYGDLRMMPPEVKAAFDAEESAATRGGGAGLVGPGLGGTTSPPNTPGGGGAAGAGAGAGAGAAAGPGGTRSVAGPGFNSGTVGNANNPGMQADPYAEFKAAFKTEFGRDVSPDEMNDNDWLLGLLDRHGSVFLQLPPQRMVGFPSYELAKLPPDALLKLFRAKGVDENGKPFDGSSILSVFSTDQLVKLAQTPEGRDFLTLEAIPYFRKAGLTSSVENLNRWLSANPTAGRPGAGGGANGGAGGTGTAEPIPTTHDWVVSIGAQDWYYKKRAEGVAPEQITTALLRQDTTADWQKRAADPRFAQLYKYAQQYNAATGWWPTAVELNQYTVKLPGVPNLSPSGDALIPKSADQAKDGDIEKWKVPTGEDGITPQPLPPGYEWRFSADGTPIPFKSDQSAAKDLFSGFYMDPKTGDWSYNPVLGAADYLQSSDPAWMNSVNGFVGRSGRLPTRDEARALAAAVWSGADPAARARAEQFAALNGFWPTPWELEFGASKDTDANQAGSGGSGQAGLGTVMVNIPGVGMRAVSAQQALKMGVGDPGLTSGQLTAGNFTLDPFQGIPGQARVWVKAVLDGGININQVPPEVQQWVQFALGAMQQQLPSYTPPKDAPDFGAGAPGADAGAAPAPAPAAPGATDAGGGGIRTVAGPGFNSGTVGNVNNPGMQAPRAGDKGALGPAPSLTAPPAAPVRTVAGPGFNSGTVGNVNNPGMQAPPAYTGGDKSALGPAPAPTATVPDWQRPGGYAPRPAGPGDFGYSPPSLTPPPLTSTGGTGTSGYEYSEEEDRYNLL